MKEFPFDHLELHLGADQLVAMGAVACMATRFEQHLNLMLEILSFSSGAISGVAHKILVNRWTNYQKRMKIMTLVREFYGSDEDFVREMDALMDRGYRLMKKRNKLFHRDIEIKTDESGEVDPASVSFTGPEVRVSSGISNESDEFTPKSTGQLVADLHSLCNDCQKMIPRLMLRSDELTESWRRI